MRAKLRVHPLFLAVGVLTAFTGGLILFLAATLAALEHERTPMPRTDTGIPSIKSFSCPTAR